jgi:anti-anti-sigma factor
MISISFEDHGKVIVLNIEGDFYIENIEEAEKIWNEQLLKQPKVVAINCKKITFIDSSAVGMLVKFLHSAMKKNIELIFFDPSDTIIGVFHTAKLVNFFKIMSRTQFEMEYLEA